jgi:hypothetical protein
MTALLALMGLTALAYGASMPKELIGLCGGLKIDDRGYQGQADSEGYGCRLRSIKYRDIGKWVGQFSCSGENPKPIRMRVFFELREFEGKRLLVVVEEDTSGFYRVLLSRPCTGR